MISYHYSSDKKINKITKQMLKVGWIYVHGRKHPRIRSPDGKTTITIPKTPSDYRAVENWVHDIKRAGYEVNE